MSEITVLSCTEHSHKLLPASSLNNTSVCFCCMTRDGTFIDLKSCEHSSFFTSIAGVVMIFNFHLVCRECHNMLQKFTLFRRQVEESIKQLYDQTTHCKPNKDLECTRIKHSSTVDSELEPNLVTLEPIRLKPQIEATNQQNLEPIRSKSRIDKTNQDSDDCNDDMEIKIESELFNSEDVRDPLQDMREELLSSDDEVVMKEEYHGCENEESSKEAEGIQEPVWIRACMPKAAHYFATSYVAKKNEASILISSSHHGHNMNEVSKEPTMVADYNHTFSTQTQRRRGDGNERADFSLMSPRIFELNTADIAFPQAQQPNLACFSVCWSKCCIISFPKSFWYWLRRR